MTHESNIPRQVKATLGKRLEVALFNEAGLKGGQVTRAVDIATGVLDGFIPEIAITVAGSRIVTDQDKAQALARLPLSDSGNAEAFAMLHGENVRYDHTRKAWRVWDGCIWREDVDGEAARLMRAAIRDRLASRDAIADETARKRYSTFCTGSESTRGIKNALEAAQSLIGIATTIHDYDCNPWLVNAGPYTIDLKACEARENRRDDLITRRLGVDYNPDAKSPRWVKFINEICGDDACMVSFLQRAAGYTMTGDTSEQKLLLLIGYGANGKSTFLSLLGRLMGDYSGVSPFEAFDAETTEAKHELATMAGRRMITVIEANEDRVLNTARVKSLTGGDVIKARALYQNGFEFKPAFKLWFALNHPPVIPQQDRGIWRRILRIPFNQSFEGREDKQLESVLIDELPGILNWAIEGLREWHQQGLNPPAAIKEATESYRTESDVIGTWMAEQCVSGANCECKAGEAWEAWRDWCIKNNERAGSQRAFGRRLTERGIGSRISNGLVIRTGLGLKAVKVTL